jgi:hypothetical protein
MGVVASLFAKPEVSVLASAKSLESKRVITDCIEKFGHMPEHHYGYLCASEDDSAWGIMPRYNDFGWLGLEYSSNMWEMITEPLAPPEKKVEVVMKVLEHALLKEKVVKVYVEFTPPFRKKVLQAIKDDGRFHARKPCDTLHWPLFTMAAWDETLSGKFWKKLRNCRNKFFKEHKVEFLPYTDFSKEELKQIVVDWGKNRKGRDQANKGLYSNIIEQGFVGFDMVRVLAIDGRACAITGGWKVPNRNAYYSSLGVLNYAVDRLGDIANLDDLLSLKKKGFEIVDFGGGGKNMLEFKKKFGYHKQYKTYIFSIVTKERQEQKLK